MSYNKFYDNQYYALAIIDATEGGAFKFLKHDGTVEIKTCASGATGGDITANNNYWGHWEGPRGVFPALKGQGDIVTMNKIVIATVLKCIDTATWCGDATTICG
jgi:hypothetical protein